MLLGEPLHAGADAIVMLPAALAALRYVVRIAAFHGHRLLREAFENFADDKAFAAPETPLAQLHERDDRQAERIGHRLRSLSRAQ